MITRFSAASAAALLVVLVGCAADPAPTTTSRPKGNNASGGIDTPDDVDQDKDPTNPNPNPNPTPNPDKGEEKLPTPDPAAGACKLPNAQAQKIQAKFTQGAPPVAKGGTLEGTYVVDDVTVILPNGARPQQSTGTVTAWGVFTKGNYNLSINVDLNVSTIIGNQPAKSDTVGQGTFKTQGETVVIETSCEGQQKPAVKSIKFSDEGAKGTLIVESEQQGRTVYLVLGATKK